MYEEVEPTEPHGKRTVIHVPRGRLINLRVNDEEWERFQRVARHYGIEVSAALRMIMKREAATLGLEPTAAQPGKSAPKPRRARKQ